jgi:hypothetical protein
MPDESLAVRRKIGLERGYDGRQYATDALTRRRNPGFRHRQKKAENRRCKQCIFRGQRSRLQLSTNELPSAVARDCFLRYTVPVRRRKRTRVRLSEPEFHHNVYVVLLSKPALKDSSILRRNPARDPSKPAVYVGMTGLPVDHRFENHKNGYKSARLVRKYGVRLLPELYEHLNPMPYEHAVQMEKDLADDLRVQGYAVAGGT